MALDAELLSDLALMPDRSLLHFYDWSAPGATFGCFTKPERFLSLRGAEEVALDLSVRPTGGGITFHIGDFAFSVLISAQHPAFSFNTLKNYETVNQMVVDVVRKFTGRIAQIGLLPCEPAEPNKELHAFCMAKPTKYDIMLNGRKIGGAAQRRTKFGLLHQGSICLLSPEESVLQKVLLPDTGVYLAMLRNSGHLLPKGSTKDDLLQARLQLRNLMQEYVM